LKAKAQNGTMGKTRFGRSRKADCVIMIWKNPRGNFSPWSALPGILLSSSKQMWGETLSAE
jgi:hypothetical protein